MLKHSNSVENPQRKIRTSDGTLLFIFKKNLDSQVGKNATESSQKWPRENAKKKTVTGHLCIRPLVRANCWWKVQALVLILIETKLCFIISVALGTKIICSYWLIEKCNEWEGHRRLTLNLKVVGLGNWPIMDQFGVHYCDLSSWKILPQMLQ